MPLDPSVGQTADSTAGGRAAESMLAGVVEASPLAIVTIDRHGKTTSWNRAAEELFGWMADEVLGHPLPNIPDMDLAYEPLEAAQVRGEECLRRRKDGALISVALWTAAQRDAQGQVTGTVVMYEDITERKAAASALYTSEIRFRTVFEKSSVGIVLRDLDYRFILTNEAYQRMVGYTEQELATVHFTDYTPPEDLAQQMVYENDLLAGKIPEYRMEKRYLRRDGSMIWVRVLITLVRDSAGVPLYLAGLAEDITEQKEAERRLRESEERYRLLVETSEDAVFILDLAGPIRFANSRAVTMFGYASADELLAQQTRDLVVPADRSDVRTHLDQALAEGRAHGLRYTCVRRDGSFFPVSVNAVVLRETAGKGATPPAISADIGRPTAIIAVVRDLTDQLDYEERLRHQGLHDALTGLPNRTLLLDRLQQGMLAATRDRSTLALLLLDVDHFKEVNDTLGHQYGDALLQQLSARLPAPLRESDTVARLGGDEFAILLAATDEQGATLAAAKLLGAMTPPFPINEQQLAVSGSIGIALYPQHGRDVHTLLRRADMAMYRAKRSHSSYAVYSPADEQGDRDVLGVMGELRTALRDDQLDLFFQPQIDLASDHIVGAEALLRWNHPAQGLVLPARFLPLAEQTGLIHDLSWWVLQTAAQTIGEWHRGGSDLRIAVNLSAHNLQDRQLVTDISQLLVSVPSLTHRLTVEITETAVMADPTRALEVIDELHGLGVGIAIDDFGTGYSSLAYLKRLPVDELKIDQSFIADIATNNESKSIARSVIDLGHNLGLHVIAEGAEDEQTIMVLRDMGCDLVQGFAIAPPLPRDRFLSWVRHYRSDRFGPHAAPA